MWLQNINAMKHSFAEPDVKELVIQKLLSAYGKTNAKTEPC